MKNITLACITVLLGFSALRCSTYRMNEKVMAENIKKQPLADSPQQLAIRTAEVFSTTPNLNNEQKQKIHTIYTKVYEESMTIRREIGQAKSLLYETLVKPGVKTTEINKISRKIVALDKKRLDIMFAALKDVRKIIGKLEDRESIYKQLGSFEN